MDTAELDVEDTAPALPETPPEPQLGEPEPDEGDGPETPTIGEPETESLFAEDVDLDEILSSDARVKAWLDEKLVGERAKADESNRRKRENEVAQAKREAETQALQAQYQHDLTEAEATYGTWGVNALEVLADHIEKNGKQGIDLKKYLSNVAGKMIEANRATAVQSLTATRTQLFAEMYPGTALSDDVVDEWTKATYSKDVAGQNRAFARAIAEAERAKVMAELESKSKADAEQASKAEEEAAKLQEVDKERRSKPRPVVNLPVGKRKQVTPADLDAIPTEQWLLMPKAERDEMIAAKDEWVRRNANR